MKITFLDKLQFRKKQFVELTKGSNPDELKTSSGKVKFDKDGDTAKISEPDLRYCWDGQTLGIHISDCAFSTQDWQQFLDENPDLISKLKVLSISRTNIESFSSAAYHFSSLDFLYLSLNDNLKEIELYHLPQLQYVEASFCPKLESVSFTGNFDFLEKIDFSNGSLKMFRTEVIHFKVLRYLNLQQNNITEIDVSKMPAIEDVFLKKNPLTNIKWPTEFKDLSIFEIDKIETFDEALLNLLDKTDTALRSGLKSYLKEFAGGKGQIPIKRLKLFFIGNTTVGKSTLRQILLDENIREEGSTHGANIFSNDFMIEGEEIFVQGFDFGGQDYYHATHLPMFKLYNSLYILVYGYEGGYPFDKMCANQFAEKLVKKHQEILYPLNYWISHFKYYTLNEKELNYRNENDDPIIRINELIKTPIANKNELTYKIKPRLVIVQNYHDPTYKLKQHDLRIEENDDIDIGELQDFDFINDHEKVKVWLKGEIKNTAKSRPMLAKDKSIGDWFQLQNNVIYYFDELHNQQFIKNLYPLKKDLAEALIRLEFYQFLDYIEPKDKKAASFYITDMKTFSNWIHTYILKESLQREGGYFTKSDIQKVDDLKMLNHLDQIITYLENGNIIFKVKAKGEEKWVAPAYLNPESDDILWDYFDSEPDVIFEFPGFFHSNIILLIINSYIANLIMNPVRKVYQLRKNKVILREHHGDANILIELVYPISVDNLESDQKNNILPKLIIKRSTVKGFVKDSFFNEVFQFIRVELAIYKHAIIAKDIRDDNGQIEYFNFDDLDKNMKGVYWNNEWYKNFFMIGERIVSKYKFKHLGAVTYDDEKNEMSMNQTSKLKANDIASNKQPVKFFIASSNELAEERNKIGEIIRSLKNTHPHLYLDTIKYETDVEYGSHDNVEQAILSELEQCDICIFLFLGELRKYTNREYIFAKNYKEKIKSFMFFKELSVDSKFYDHEKYGILKKFKEGLEQELLYDSSFTDENFAEKVKDRLNPYLSKHFPPR